MKILYTLTALVVLASCNKQQADKIIHNANIYTIDDDLPQATAVVIKEGLIEAVGGEELLDNYHADEVIDAGGQMMLPGFNDSHVHLMQGGNNLLSVKLRDASTREEFIRRIGAFAKELPKGTWITGGDWDHTLWGGELPRKEWIDSVTLDHPVWINRLDGHMALANSAALTAAGIDGSVENIEGGEIVRDSDDLTGIFKDNAMYLVEASQPKSSAEARMLQLEAAQEYLHSNGVTSVTDMGTWEDQEFYEESLQKGKLKVRIYSCVPLSTYRDLAEKVKINGKGNEWLRIGGLKGFVDGSLGSHTAAFLEPYEDLPADSGFFVTDMNTMGSDIRGAVSEGLHVCIHAIGDRAIRSLLDLYEGIEADPSAYRFRVEHAQHIDPGDIGRFGELGVIASMQPYHAIDDGRWADELIGEERSKTTYAFKDLSDAGAILAFGSDWFVAPATPLEGIYAAVTRQTLDGANPNGWIPEQKISLNNAVQAYTIGSAYASFSEDEKGSITKGKLADLIILDQDLFEIAPEEIRNVRVMSTFIAGERVWYRK